MTKTKTTAATPANLKDAVRTASGHRVNPTTGQRFRRTKDQIAELERAILGVVAAERPLTLRRLHYALVSLGLQPNTLSDYRELSRRVVAMRRARLIPPGAFVDNSRETIIPYMWGSLDELLDSAVAGYRRNPWAWSDDRALIMVEKDALRGALEATCDGLGVPLGIARGRASESWLEGEAGRINAEMPAYKGLIHIGYIGDWDPTGWANPADIEKRLRGFLADRGRMTFTRLGLDPAQITALGLPQAMAAKTSDPNYRRWPGGNVAVEVDAAPISDIQGWVEDFVRPLIPATAFTKAEKAAKADIARLTRLRQPNPKTGRSR